MSPPTEGSTVKGDVMIVDDTLPNLRLLSTMLTEKGYKVRGVTNGETALTAVSFAPPDLILLDISMPDMDGYEVCRRLKANEQTKQIPVIFISAMNEVLDKVRAFAIGGVDYITKPYHVEEVLMRVKTHLTLRHLQVELEQANAELRRLVTLDGLTQIANRRRFDEYLSQEWLRSAREQQPLSLIFCDIDYFKPYNDTYGHQTGDDCLRRVAQALEKVAHRPADLAARYGGEEFALILPNTPLSGAEQVGQSLQTHIADLRIEHSASQISPYLTLSVGIAVTVANANNTPEHLLKRADQALYQAKDKGRNCIVCVEV